MLYYYEDLTIRTGFGPAGIPSSLSPTIIFVCGMSAVLRLFR